MIGIVASRIVERYERPAILIAIDGNGIGKGSGRSVEGLNIYSALTECSELFEQFGGHEQAAGLSIKAEKIERFREMFEKAIAGSGHAYEPRLDIDCEVDLSQLTDALLTELGMLEPYGIGNPEPVLAARSVEVVSQRTFKDKHLGLRLRQGNVSLDGIWFNSGEVSTLPGKIDIAFTPEFNKWNGRKDIRLRILDVNL